MNTAELAPLVRPGQVSAPPGGRRRAVFALARLEGLRLLRHPLVLAAAALSGWLLWQQGSAALPVLYTADLATQLALAPLAAATMLAANLATLRSVRHHTEELYQTVQLTPASRTSAHMLAVLPIALLAALLAGVHLAWLASDEYAAGSANLVEVATGPVAVLASGVLGVAVGRLAPVVAIGPVALFGVLVVHLTVFVVPGSSWLWLALLVPDLSSAPGGPVPDASMMGRPAGWHLVYVLALSAAIGSVALHRAGARRLTLVGGAAALVAAVVAAGVQLAATPPSVRGAQIAAAESKLRHECHRRGTVTYCAYPNFTPRIRLWDQAVVATRDSLPAAVATQPLRVNQSYSRIDWSDPAGLSVSGTVADAPTQDPDSPIPVDTGWPRGDEAGGARLRLGVWTAQRALRLPPLSAIAPDSSAQCRRVGGGGVALWAGAQAGPGAEAALRTDVRDLRRSGGDGVHVQISNPQGSLLDGNWTLAEGEQALQLLSRPRAEVRRLLAGNWGLLTRPDTTLVQIAEALGLPAPKTPGPGVTQPCR